MECLVNFVVQKQRVHATFHFIMKFVLFAAKNATTVKNGRRM